MRNDKTSVLKILQNFNFFSGLSDKKKLVYGKIHILPSNEDLVKSISNPISKLVDKLNYLAAVSDVFLIRTRTESIF